MRVALACLAALLVVAVAEATAATAHPGLDRAYGKGGVVRVVPPAAPDAPDTAGVQSFGPVPDGSTYVIASDYVCKNGCGYEYSLGRYDGGGDPDAGFGGAPGGFVPLPGAGRYSVTADEGAALVVGFAGKGIVLRRFTAAGAPDRSFGKAGVATIPCPCGGEVHLHAFVEPDGKILVDVDRGDGFNFDDGTHVRLTRLLPDGKLDRGFGKSGTAGFSTRGPGAPTSVATTTGDATLIGGSGFALLDPCCGRRHIYLRRVSPDGRADRRFDRNARRSLERIEIRGRFPTLTAVVAGDDGTISVLGYGNETGGGFDMRLRADGRLDRGFGRGGVLHLPFTVSGAVGGIDGAIFAVGSPGKNPYGYATHAFRILRDGGLAPGSRRGRGIEVPVGGTRMAVTSLGDGRVLVTDNGNSYCREACPPEPAMARFLE